MQTDCPLPTQADEFDEADDSGSHAGVGYEPPESLERLKEIDAQLERLKINELPQIDELLRPQRHEMDPQVSGCIRDAPLADVMSINGPRYAWTSFRNQVPSRPADLRFL